jgi:hypothetical protein
VSEGASFGGRDVDVILSQFFANYLVTNWNPDVSKLYIEDAELLSPEVIAYKENVLSPALANETVVDTFQYVHRHFRRTHFLRSDAPLDRMDRELFGKIASEHLQTFVRLVNGAIDEVTKSGKLTGGDDIDLAILTGGHSRWYFIREILCGKWVPGLPGNPRLGSGAQLAKLLNDKRRCLFSFGLARAETVDWSFGRKRTLGIS